MCCLFGLMDCRGYFGAKKKTHILSVLASECEERGTDATGIAYCTNGHLSIYKRPVAAHKLRFRIPGDSRVIMGHTRMATQGNAGRNRNNHPFPGNAAGGKFALAHNGVLYNDRLLRQTNGLPKTKIETDSYIAVQLIEQQKALDFSSLKYMAEQVEGTFSFTVLDEHENLYFVKGDNPLCLYHYPRNGVYLYASTEAILTRALNRLRLPLGKPERIELMCSDILKITASGQQAMSAFDASNLILPWGYWSLWPDSRKNPTKNQTAENEYLDELKSVACCYGYSPDAVDRMLASGFTTENACRNALLLEEILATGTISWKDGRKETAIPLCASVVVLCDTVSSLCCSPQLFTLDIPPEDLDLALCRGQLEQAPVHQDYLQALASYTAAHWPELQEALRQGRAQAAAFAVNADILAVAGTLLGVVRFADAFFRFCGAEDASIFLNGSVTPETLQELFSQAASGISGTDAAQQFCRIAQRCMAGDVFSVCDADRDDSDGSKPVVYLIGADYGFPAEAFRTVCRRMSQSTPVIAQALSEAGLLRGKRTNATTVQTRIPVTNVYGHCRYVGVYRIAQEDILSEML